jgi:hypothetical protein
MLCLRHSDFCQRKVDYTGIAFLEVAMNVISNVSMRAIPGTQANVHPVMAIALLCGLAWAQLSAWRLSAWI